jgi:very-short-patch-repair endonuclease
MPHQMLARARALRSNPTLAERRFWGMVRMDRLGVRFRRQHRIGDYIVDFVCFDWRLIVELDGGQHAGQTAYDERRTVWLEQQGFQVMRFWNADVLRQPDGVIDAILARRRAGVGTVAS